MSLVETLHREHLERQLRFAQAALKRRETSPTVTYVIERSARPVEKPEEWAKRQKQKHDDIAVPQRTYPAIEEIQRLVCTHFGVTRTEMLSARRTAEVVRPRQVAVYLCRRLTLRSLPEIGRRFGGRDHTTQLWACRRVEYLMKKDEQLTASVEMLTHLLGGERA